MNSNQQKQDSDKNWRLDLPIASAHILVAVVAIPVIAAVIPYELPITTIIVIVDNNHWYGLRIPNRCRLNMNRLSPFLPVKKRIYVTTSAI